VLQVKLLNIISITIDKMSKAELISFARSGGIHNLVQNDSSSAPQDKTKANDKENETQNKAASDNTKDGSNANSRDAMIVKNRRCFNWCVPTVHAAPYTFN
jgi:hypothetical protein